MTWRRTVFTTNLSAVLATARAGGTVVITNRGTPVARLDPADVADDPAGHTAALAARGVATLPTARLSSDFFDAKRPSDPTGRVLAALLAERGNTSEPGRGDQ